MLEASAAARTAIPLPGNLKDWVPAVVRVDGKEAPPLSHTDDGTLWLALSPGAFRVEMTGPLPPRETIQIALPLKPRFVTAHVRGWTLDGLHEDGAADESLKLSRAGRGAEKEAAPPDESGVSVSLAPFLRVTRTLHLGLKWEVETVVARETPTGAPVVIDVPLLSGEAVTTAGGPRRQGQGGGQRQPRARRDGDELAIDADRVLDVASARRSGVRAPVAPRPGCWISGPPGTRRSPAFRRSSAPTPTARASPSGAPGPARRCASN